MKWNEAGVAVRFTAIFIGTYLILNALYGWWVESQYPKADSMTVAVARQCAATLRWSGYDAQISELPAQPSVHLMNPERTVLNVFEGCNGLNVMIVFVSFILATAKRWKVAAIFGVAGIMVIHLFNILRINLLYWLSMSTPNLFHYFHKYLFTATIYGVVFLLWAYWMTKLNGSDTGKS
ncbi:MAG: exosortase family protein XrtF [Bacteroidetes bacterium]|nr:exosortase family protein XrtF [Bacteroidota bacterium]